MSKVERKEYQETKIMRTVSPGRQTGSSQNLSQFDNKLDYLLDDLQSSVSGGGGGRQPALTNNTYREVRVMSNSNGSVLPSDRSNSLNRVTHLKPSNPVTEYTSNDSYSYTLPDGTASVKTFKKESYSSSYSSDRPRGASPEKTQRYQTNINQLDSLLDDLKQVKQAEVVPTAETHKSRVVMGKKVVERELHYGDTPPSTRTATRTLERSSREGSVNREVHQYIDEGTYGETRPVRYNTPSPNPNQSTITRQKKVTNVQTYPVEVVETTTPDINPEILSHLDPDLLPTGSTKVTTTIKTYTYEIPGGNTPGYKSGPVSPVPDKYVYSPNDSQTTPSRSFVYNKTENRDITNTTTHTTTATGQPPPVPDTNEPWKTNLYREIITDENVPPYQKPSSPPSTGRSVVKETTTTRHYQPNYPADYNPQPITVGGKQTYIYNETTTTRNISDDYPPQPVRQQQLPPPPKNETTYLIRETVQNSSTTTNPDDDYPRRKRRPVDEGPMDSRGYPVYNPPPPTDNININYKYSTHTTTSNSNYGNGHVPSDRYPPDSGEESRPLLLPRPFPTDESDVGPPKRVDELMAKIGPEPPDSPLNIGFQAHEVEHAHQKRVETLKRQQQQAVDEAEDMQKKERTLVPTKNITGPPVYYPPGHEMFAKKEESGAAWRAQGAWARESGKYEREAESSSKYQVKTGAAMVPVCLPCCCGLPCVIM